MSKKFPDLFEYDLANLIEEMDEYVTSEGFSEEKYNKFINALEEGLEDFNEEMDFTIKDKVNELSYEDAKKLYTRLRLIIEG